MKSSQKLKWMRFLGIGVSLIMLMLVSFVYGSSGCNLGFDPICTSIPTSNCEIIQNITFIDGNYSIYGIDVCSDNITINCAGAEFASPYLNYQYGMNINLHNGVQIHNCTLKNYDMGIVVNNSHSARIYDNNLINNRNNILLANSSRILILNNVANSHSLFPAIYGNNSGILLDSANNNTITNNTFAGSVHGMTIIGSNDNWIIGNKLYNNTLGIFINASNRSNLHGNNASRNNQEGIFILNSSLSNLSYNIVTYNKASGLFISPRLNIPDTNYLDNNQFCYNRPYSPYFDIRIRSYIQVATGINNTCQRTQNYNDTMQNGCTNLCGDPNLPPVQFLPIPNMTTQEDTPISFDIYDYFYDPGGNYLIVSSATLQNMNITAVNPTGITTFVPFHNVNGNLNLVLEVNDSTQHSMPSNSFVIHVTPSNDPPMFITSPVSILVAFNQPLTIQLQAIDPDNDTLTYSTNAGSVLPNPFLFNTTSGYFTWIPVNMFASYLIQFNVTDGQQTDTVNIPISVQGALSSSHLIENFSSLTRQNTIFDWLSSSAYYDGFNHKVTLGLLPIPGLSHTDVELNYSFEFTDTLTNQGWQVTYPGASAGNIFTTSSLAFEGNRSMQVNNIIFEHDFNVILSNQNRKSCMVWHDNGNNQSLSYIGFDRVTTNTAGIFMGYNNIYPSCNPLTYCIFASNPQFWRNTNINRTIGWHQFCMLAKNGSPPDFTWDAIRVLNNTGGLDLDLISSYNAGGVTTHVDNIRLWSGYDANKNILNCRNFGTVFYFNNVTLIANHTLNSGSILYQISNDNGQQWKNISSGGFVFFNQSSQSFTCRIIFSQGTSASTSPDLNYLRFSFSNQPLNSLPVLYPIQNKTVLENQTLIIQLNSSDVENNTLVFSFSGTMPHEYTFNTSTGLFTWTPRFIDQGVYSANFSVSDGNATASRAITITVQDVSHASITRTGNATLGNTVTFSLSDSTMPNTDYIFAMALGNYTGIALPDGRIISLDPDFVFYSMINYPSLLGYSNSVGTLDNQGKANVTWNVPYLPYAVGVTVYVSYVTFNASVPGGLFPSIAPTLPVTIS